MKAISIRQPWASLSAAGLRDIDISNRDTKYRGPVLLVSSARKVGRDFGHDVPQEWYCRLRNAQALGMVPYDEELPVGAAIGYAMLEDCTTEMQPSPWSAVGNNWVLRNARLFRTPVFGIKGKQGLYDVPEISEDQLPESFEQMQPWSAYDDGVFSLSMTEAEQDRQLPDFPLVLMCCGDGLLAPIMTGEAQPQALSPIRMLRLVSSTRVQELPVSSVELLSESLFELELKYIVVNFEATPHS